MTQAITRIERARDFLEAAQLSTDWVREVGERSEQVIRRDVLVKQHGLNERQTKALGHLRTTPLRAVRQEAEESAPKLSVAKRRRELLQRSYVAAGTIEDSRPVAP
jgi:hypothetical protein